MYHWAVPALRQLLVFYFFCLLDEPWLGNVFVISIRVAERMYEGVRNGPVWGALRMWSLECARAVEGTGLRHRL